MKEILECVEREVPYNSAGKVYLAAKKKYDARFGGNCVYQNRILTDKLVSEGLPREAIGYLKSVGRKKGHFATVCSDGNELFFLEPTFLAREAVSLSKLVNNDTDRVVVCDAYPVIKEHPSKLVFQHIALTRFAMTMLLFLEGRYQPVLSTEYDLDQLVTELPQKCNISTLLKPSPRSFVLKVLGGDDQVTDLRYMIDDGSFYINKLGGWAYSSKNESDKDLFLREFERVSQELSVSVSDLLTFFDRARQYLMEMQYLLVL